MIKWVMKKFLGTKNQREVKRLWPLVQKINSIEEELQSLTDAQIQAKTPEFKERLAKGETTDDILPEAFAVVKNVCRRMLGKSWQVCEHSITWEMVPFDVQLIGAIVLHGQKIAEMATGEGKTLVATMPLYLNALTGNNVNLVTVNDYLARRDKEWMGPIYEFLGLTVGCLQNEMAPQERKKIYACDITYGTNSEFGFDYLRDNSMIFSKDDQVQRSYYYAIIDEIDSILIDEARTPLIISGPSTVTTHGYDDLKPRVSQLVQKQNALCNGLLKEAKDILDKGDEGKQLAGVKLHQVQWGMPKNKQLLKLMEQPDRRRLLEKTEMYFLSDINRDEKSEMKEELYFVIEEKHHVVELTEKGREFLNINDPNEFILPDIVTLQQEIESDEGMDKAQKEAKKRTEQVKYEKTAEKLHNLSQLLRAFCLFDKDKGYVVQDNRVFIVDEFTGRIMPGRRYSDGLHQALEAKEGVKVERETQTLATITIQNYFRMYEKLSGMTGTAETEANEFFQIYKLDVIVIPTNKPVIRDDRNDVIYKTRREKYNAVSEEIAELHKQGRPVLVGTVSVDTSEVISRFLKRKGVAHAVLNAKYHQKEAEIVRNAGQMGSVTIATNMAGRGTDIKLGEGVVDRGGLYVIGSERHEARRIDRQLRGRCARQGDPGGTKFYVSLEDDLMRLFGSDRVANIMARMGLEEGQELAHPLLSRAIEKAQKRVEERNFSIRKHTLEYDDVMNKQRETVYGLRNEILHSDDTKSIVLGIIDDVVMDKVEADLNDADKDISALINWVNSTFLVGFRPSLKEIENWKKAIWHEKIMQVVEEAYLLKEDFETPPAMRNIERYVMLNVIDRLWKEHLYGMDGLRESVGLRAYAQQDPLVEYKQEGFKMFAEMMQHIYEDITSGLFSSSFSESRLEKFLTNANPRFSHQVFEPGSFDAVSKLPGLGEKEKNQSKRFMGQESGNKPITSSGKTFKRTDKKVGRNEPCPCGSGKKYKQCCGK